MRDIETNKIIMDAQTNNQGLFNLARIADISQYLFDHHQFAYFLLDQDWRVQETSNNIQDFGFSALPIGSDATDEIDFLVGMDVTENHELPMISSPAGDPIRVMFIPSDAMIIVVILDAEQEFIRQKQLQQKANENQLLLETQDKLLAKIEGTKKILESQNLQLQEASRLQSSFLSGVSHEFRTPLASIIGYTNLLLADQKNQPSSDNQEYLSAVKRSSKHLLSLIENLLDHGKFDSNEITLNPKPNDLVEVFHDVELLVRPLATTKQIDFEMKHSLNAEFFAVLDDSRLRQCLINIIGNAIKFTDVGGVYVEVIWEDDELQITVKDTGIGISKNNLAKIKQPFWQAPDTGKSGTGLGLTITERIIELMGGVLTIDSVEAKGTTVNFSVLAPQVEMATQQELTALQTLSKPLNLLLVEDDSDIAFLVSAMLEEKGVLVTHLHNGALAVERLQTQKFDLVLMDLHMPILDGYGAIEQIRASGNQIPILIMTASAIEADRGRAEELGCDGYLVKPVDIADLIALAEQLVS